MNKCPKCGAYMNFYIEYVCGNPICIYSCSCGYSTKNSHYSVSNNTTPIKSTNEVI